MNIRSKCPYPPLATTCLISRCRCWPLSRTSGQSSASPPTSWSPWRRTSPRSSAAASGSSPTVADIIFLQIVHITYPLSVGGGINPAACNVTTSSNGRRRMTSTSWPQVGKGVRAVNKVLRRFHIAQRWEMGAHYNLLLVIERTD